MKIGKSFSFFRSVGACYTFQIRCSIFRRNNSSLSDIQCVAVKSDTLKKRNKQSIKTNVFHVDHWNSIQKQFGIYITLFLYVRMAYGDKNLKEGTKWVAGPGNPLLAYRGQILHNESLRCVDCVWGVLARLGLGHAPEETVEWIAVDWGWWLQLQRPVMDNVVKQPRPGRLGVMCGSEPCWVT